MSEYYDKYIPDSGPEGSNILFVGEAPGETEYDRGTPFVGPSGDILRSCIARYGVEADSVRLANLCHYRPKNNDFKRLLSSQVLREGIRELGLYIRTHRPNIIVPLGAYPLKYLTGKIGIKKWRGSIIPYLGDPTIKCIPTLHPAAVLRQRELYPIFDLDIKRILEDSLTPDFNLPKRQFVLNPTGLELEEWVQTLCAADTLAVDIETIKRSSRILCVGFAPSKDVGVCIVPAMASGRRAIERILMSDAKKVFQLGNFDTIQLRDNGYQIHDPYGSQYGRDYYWDTLYAQHVIAPELPRSLEFLTSIYTRQPYYKTVGRGTIPDDEKGWSDKVEKQSLYEYNAQDCCCTFEVFEKQRAELLHPCNKNLLHTFDFVMQTIPLAVHISQAGLPIDMERRELIERALVTKWAKRQAILDRLTGYTTNVRSPKLKSILYDKDKLALPVRRNRTGGITTDEDAIVSLIAHCQSALENLKTDEARLPWRVRLGVCKTILEIRGIRQVLSNYIVKVQRTKVSRFSLDGRLRSMYKVGPETGRWAASKYVDGTGINAQTVPRDPIEIPDEELIEHNGTLMLLDMLNDEPDVDDFEEEEDEE